MSGGELILYTAEYMAALEQTKRQLEGKGRGKKK
jgi:hypothetical protein